MPSPLTTSDIQAAPGATPAPPTPTPEPPAPDAPEENKGPTDYTGPGAGGSHPAAMLETLPEDLLQNPLIFAVAKGNPAAVSAPDKSKDPAVLAVVKHAQPLVAAGFGIYQSVDKKTDVLFNTQSMHPDDLLQADRAGKLLDLAPPFDSIKGPATTAAPVATPGGAAPAPAGAPPSSQPAASVQKKLATIRGKNLSPISPTGGAAPGAGNILNSILRPAV